MSLFDDASLAMIPSAYKDGKLYSIKPTDGSGDFTFTRGSNLAATRVDVNGLIEKGRENLLLQSNQFDTTWGSIGASVTSGQSGYDGSNDAWLLENTVSFSYIRQDNTTSGVLTASIYAKSGNVNYMRFAASNSPIVSIYFDLVNGVGYGASNLISHDIEDVGNEWHRYSVSFLASSMSGMQWYPADGAYDLGEAGDNIYIQDAQLEQGLVATDYIETTTTTAQAGILEDMPRLDYSGGASCPSLLLEPQRSNLITQSEYFGDSSWTKLGSGTASVAIVTSNYATSPDGSQNASRLQCDLNGGTTISDQSVIYDTITGSGDTSAFVYVKSNTGSNQTFYLANTLTDRVSVVATTEWQKFELNWNASANGRTLGIGARGTTGSDDTLDLLIWGAQVEVGSYPTSYIPTYGTSQTRSDDFMNISSLADEIDGNSFTYFLEINNEAVVRDSATGNISVGASGNRFFLYNDSSATARMKLYIQDVTTQSYQLSADNVKLVVRIEPNKVEVFENGVSVLSTTQNLDFSGNSSYVLRGATREMGIKQTAIFPTPLTDSECIALTTI
jgi:hypothetical protein